MVNEAQGTRHANTLASHTAAYGSEERFSSVSSCIM
jgi:hypothetical protein